MTRRDLKKTVIAESRKYRVSFEEITGGFEDRGILNSEMLCVCSVSEALGVDVFIESGRWRGQSTEILSRYFEGKPVIVESIEVFRDENALHVEEKMKSRKNIRLRYGDANDVVPRLVKRYAGKKIAILFDGPKGGPALDIFRLALAKNDSIVAGFFHDMRKPTEEMPNQSRREMEGIFPESFFTDDDDFVREFGSMDKTCEVALWRPYHIDGKKIGSYGPTIGLILPDRQDIFRARKDALILLVRTKGRFLFLLGIKTFHWVRNLAKR
jgi:hypothetical protein